MKLVVIGGSWGGLDALMETLGAFPTDFPAPIVIAQHRSNTDEDEKRLANVLSRYSSLPVADADHGQRIKPARVYLAPADYHLLVEQGHFELNVDDPVHHSRPAIDVLFESAARAYGPDVVAVLLTGLGRDGTEGMRAVKDAGGVTIAQNPDTAMQGAMPQSAVSAGVADEVLELDDIPGRLLELVGVAV